MSDFDIIADNAITLGLNDLQYEVDNMIRPSRDLVKQKALQFITAYESIDARYKELLALKNKSQSRHLKQWAELEVARESFDEFQNAINAYYGQLMKVMYVYMNPETGQIILSAEDNSASLLTINKDYQNVQYHLNQLKNVFKLDDYDSTLLDATEQSIYARWNIAKSVCKSNRFLPILWKLNGVWQGVKVNNLGTIAEAYVNFYLAKFQFSGMLEQDVGTYIMHPSMGAASVDNMSGFLIGDSSALDGKVQFAVKKDTASAMRMATVYKEVKAIINSEDFIESIGKRFIDIEKEKARKNQTKALSNNLEQTYEQLISELQHKLT